MKRVLIVGLGLIGGSYAKALHETGEYRIDAYDMNQTVLEEATRCGVIERGFTDVSIVSNRYDVVLIALHPTATLDFVQMSSFSFISQAAVVCDVAGLQDVIVTTLRPYLIERSISYISLHPMAGRERSGFEMATASLFRGKSCLYTNVTATQGQLDFICELHRQIGFQYIQAVDATLHDQIIAYTSQLPHIVSVAFMNVCQERDVKGFTGGSFEDMTRVSDINSELWGELFLENKIALLQEIKQFKLRLAQIETALDASDAHELTELMKQSSQAKRNVKAQLLKEVWDDA